MWDCVLVRYSEIAIKSRPVRSRFERILVNNISLALKGCLRDYRVQRKWGRIVVEAKNTDRVCERLSYVFGVVSISPAKRLSLRGLPKFVERNVSKLVQKGPFAVRVTRVGEHSFTSRDMERKLGEIVVKKTGKKVNLKEPASTLHVEIREKDAYVYNDVISGPMGLPLGSQGKVYCFVNDKLGILAAWLMMKRGCRPIIFHTAPVDELDRWSPGMELEKTEISSLEELAERAKGDETPVVLADTLNTASIEGIKADDERFYCVLRPLIGYTEDMVKELRKRVLG
ncbi:hypothetical protein A3K63_02510 [Candidatus Micrarchaeota archaeon RBG_16_49_10]|nr:MAG: hypothetical protein A3K63_02510 [Candidatus Micrarchaeota archaeon RBG_16_49_10]